jgi:polysaccharide biosynthesis transport protein
MRNPFKTQMPSAEPAGFGPLHPMPAAEDDGIDLIGIWRTVRKRAGSILLFTFAVTLLGAAVAFSLPKIYRSTATIAVEPPSSQFRGGTNRVEEAAPINPFAESLQTQIEIMRSRDVVIRAVEAIQLWRHPLFSGEAKSTGWAAEIKNMVGLSAEKPKPAENPQAVPVRADEDPRAAALVGAFGARVTVSLVPRTQIISVSFDSEDPDLSARAANALVGSFIEEDRRLRLQAAQGLNTSLIDRSTQLLEDLRKAERNLQSFREKNDLVNLRGASQALSATQMEQLMPKVVSARVKVTELETALKQVREVNDGDYTNVPWVMNYGTVPAARDRVIASRFKVAELSENYGYEHPRMIQAQAELKEAGENLRRQIGVAVASLTKEYDNARATERALKAVMTGERSQVRDVNRIEFQLGQLEREVESSRQLYDAFIARAKQLEVAGDIERSIARVVNSARPSGSPYSPNVVQMILIFFAAGLALSVGLAVFLDRLDNTIKGPSDAEIRLGLPALTTVPLIDEGQQSGRLLTRFIDDSGGSFSEAFRTARTGLLLSALDDPSRVFMVTSSTPGEGKTTVSTNLALALAQSQRALLIEADMRKPRLARDLGLPEQTKGLANLAAGTATMEECLYSIEGSSLKVMPTGDIPPNPLDLLFSHRFEETIESLKAQFDFIVIDTPPVELVSDAVAVSRIASSVLYVVRGGSTPFPLVVGGLEKLRRAEAPLLGLVLNRIDLSKAHKYYGEYGGYGISRYGNYSYYGAGYGYGYVGRTKPPPPQA